MIRSMTGFGKASLEKNSRKYQVEIKSVNHRYLDISVKMPRTISFLEEEVKKEISKYVRNTEDTIILYCSSGSRSRQAKEILENLGYSEVYNLKEGIDKIWIK